MANELGSFVRDEVSRTETDFRLVRDRALSITSVAGGLVALLTGLLSIAAGSDSNVLPVAARWLVGAAMLAFVVSTMCALRINLPSDVTAADDTALSGLVADHWNDDGWDQQTASLLVDYLASLREANATSMRWLTSAIAFEIAGVAITAVASIVVVANVGHHADKPPRPEPSSASAAATP